MIQELEAKFKAEVVDKFPQYKSYLNDSMKAVKANRDYKGGRPGDFWYRKGEVTLSFGAPETRKIWNNKTNAFDKEMTYITVYSYRWNGLVLAPYHHFSIVEEL